MLQENVTYEERNTIITKSHNKADLYGYLPLHLKSEEISPYLHESQIVYHTYVKLKTFYVKIPTYKTN